MFKSEDLSRSFSKRLSGLCLGAACLSVACGPSLEGDRMLTPEERLLEQERLQYEAEVEAQKHGPIDVDVEEEEVELFDPKGAEMELKRASLSAVTCPEVVESKKHPQAVAEISIVFNHDGKVSDASIADPFEGELAECILNAYRSVIVKPFRESEYRMDWQLDLTKKALDAQKQKKSDADKATPSDDNKKKR